MWCRDLHHHPDLQFGPVSVVAAIPFTFLPATAEKHVAAAVMSAAGLLLLRGLAVLVPTAERWRLLVVGLFVIPAREAPAGGRSRRHTVGVGLRAAAARTPGSPTSGVGRVDGRARRGVAAVRIADPASVAVAATRLAVSPSSVWRLFDVNDSATPWWCRPVHLLGGGALGVLLWQRNRIVGVLAVGSRDGSPPS